MEAHQPDVAFLDIRMPALSGLEVASRLTVRPHVVFVTAYDEHAIQAFDNAALDYLLKPVSLQRLGKTVARLKALLADKSGEPLPKLSQLLALLPDELRAKPAYLQRIQVSANGDIVIVPVDNIDFFQAADKYTLAVTPEREWIIRKPLKELEAELDPERFWRVHRNAIVRLAAIERAMQDARGGFVLQLHRHQQTLGVGRSYQHRFKAD